MATGTGNILNELVESSSKWKKLKEQVNLLTFLERFTDYYDDRISPHNAEPRTALIYVTSKKAEIYWTAKLDPEKIGVFARNALRKAEVLAVSQRGIFTKAVFKINLPSGDKYFGFISFKCDTHVARKFENKYSRAEYNISAEEIKKLAKGCYVSGRPRPVAYRSDYDYQYEILNEDINILYSEYGAISLRITDFEDEIKFGPEINIATPESWPSDDYNKILLSCGAIHEEGRSPMKRFRRIGYCKMEADAMAEHYFFEKWRSLEGKDLSFIDCISEIESLPFPAMISFSANGDQTVRDSIGLDRLNELLSRPIFRGSLVATKIAVRRTTDYVYVIIASQYQKGFLILPFNIEELDAIRKKIKGLPKVEDKWNI